MGAREDVRRAGRRTGARAGHAGARQARRRAAGARQARGARAAMRGCAATGVLFTRDQKSWPSSMVFPFLQFPYTIYYYDLAHHTFNM
ncbi:hypothetical protein CRG98_040762 [Punica granatum]|uniref:Uncharacterized protein n=1 Tax=Punica granatum TaxID=22663 RepID=A0A2I0I4F1_PUNGR|nr:hypothetical protein CRG98_040762 [Punica granatum]